MSWLSDMFSNPEVPQAPNYGPLIGSLTTQANEANNLSREQFAFFRKLFDENKGDINAINARAKDWMDFNIQNAKSDRQRYESVYRPLEDQAIQRANYLGSDGYKEQQRGRATANVGQAFEASRQNLQRDLEGYGINPGALRFGSMDTAIRTAEGATKASAANQSDLATDAQADNARARMIAVGQTLPAQVLAQGNAGLNAGGGAASNLLNLTNSGVNSMGTGTQWGSLGTNALLGAGNLQAQQYKDQMAYYDAQNKQSSGLGSLLGFAGSLAADYFLPGSGMAIRGMMGGSGGDDGGWSAEDGGQIPERVPEEASPSGGQQPDDVSARLTPGEFVLPRYAVAYYGTDKLQKMIMKAREAYGIQDQEPAAPKRSPALDRPPSYVSPSTGQARTALPRGA